MKAYWRRSVASALMSAPASSSTLKPPGLREGQRTAMAGRLMPGQLAQPQHGERHQRAGVAAGDATCDSPSRTASIAVHMLVPWPWRMTWEGLSSIATTPRASRTSQRPSSLRRAIEPVELVLRPWTMKCRSGFFSAIWPCRDHGRGAAVSAHRVDGEDDRRRRLTGLRDRCRHLRRPGFCRLTPRRRRGRLLRLSRRLHGRRSGRRRRRRGAGA